MGANANAKTEPEPSVRVEDFCRDAAHAVPLSGLLASDPLLIEAELTPTQWQQALDNYLKAPPPSEPAPVAPAPVSDEATTDSDN